MGILTEWFQFFSNHILFDKTRFFDHITSVSHTLPALFHSFPIHGSIRLNASSVSVSVFIRISGEDIDLKGNFHFFTATQNKMIKIYPFEIQITSIFQQRFLWLQLICDVKRIAEMDQWINSCCKSRIYMAGHSCSSAKSCRTPSDGIDELKRKYLCDVCKIAEKMMTMIKINVTHAVSFSHTIFLIGATLCVIKRSL